MLEINETTFRIGMTKGDRVTIEFSANSDESEYLAVSGDVLRFAFGKKWNEPLVTIENTFGTFENVTITATEFNEHKTKYFTKSGDTYVRCSENSAYSSSTTYYVSTFWDIEILPEHTQGLKAGEYFYDVQLNDETIIGKTDTITPILNLWEEEVK